MLIDMAGRLGATAIVSVPSFLDRVADYAAAQSVDLAALGVRRLVCIGEPVRTQGFAPNALARQIAGAWGANVYSTYGATEIASSMCECEEGRGGHAHPSLFYAEILDDNDNPVEPGRTGELVVTTFGVEAMPLVRFKTGDVAFMVDERCPCGRHTPRLGPILGRKNERLKLKGTTVFPAAVYNILNDVEAVRDYVLVVTSDGALVDRLEVVVDCGSTCERLRTEISERLRGGLRVTPDVTMADGEGISRIRCDEGYRKKRLLVDRRDAARGDRD
jgi:phenylacetate-CoA ligase